MRGNSYIAHILRVRMRLHYTWFIAFALITAIVATQFPEAYPLWKRLLLGITASLLFGVAISIRQLAITFVALRRRISLKNVTLFVFGGVPGITKEATLPVLELLLALSGLLSSLTIAGLFYSVYVLLVITGSIIMAGLIQWLTFITLMLTLFHFVPGFPLDGGRIFRAILWKATGDYDGATRIASWIGQGISLLFVAGGIMLTVLTRQWFTGLVLAFVGWVLYIAAAQTSRRIVMRKALRNIAVRDIMSRECPLVTQQLSLSQLVRDFVLVTGQCYFLVVDDAGLKGIATLRKVKSVPKKYWGSIRVGEIMTPASRLRTAHADQLASDLLEQMNELGIDRMPVLAGEEVVGVVARESLIRLAKTRADLRL